MIRLKFPLFIVLAFLLTKSVGASPTGAIEGRVLDAECLEPLIGVNMYVEGTSVGAATNGLGWYSISRVPLGKHRVVARMMGYEEQSQNVVLTADQTRLFLDFTLTEMVIPLDEIVVTARREAISLATTTSEVTQEDIRAQGALTVAEALKTTPGLHVSMRCPYEGTGVYVRGFERHQTKVLIDGIPVYEPFRKVFDLSMIPAGIIDKIKIVKGPSSVLYGANTMGGVVNVITKKRAGKPLTELTCSCGRDGTQRYQIDHGAGFGKFNYWLSGSYGTSDGFRLSKKYNSDAQVSPFEDGGLRDNSDYSRRALALSLGFRPSEDGEVNFSFLINDGEAGLPVPPNPTKLTEGSESYHWRFKDKDRWQAGFVSRFKPTSWLSVKGSGFYANTKITLDAYSDGTFGEILYSNFSDSRSIGGFLHARLHHGQIGFRCCWGKL
jgi:outer membrane receptor protein involved in Fe transport